MKILRLISILPSLIFIGLMVYYKDPFYLLFAFVFLIFSFLIIFPSLLARGLIKNKSKTSETNDNNKINKIGLSVENRKDEPFYLKLKFFILLIFLLFSCFLTYNAVYKLESSSNVQNYVKDYYQSQLLSITPFFPYIFLGLLLISFILSVLLFRLKSKTKNISFFVKQFVIFFLLFIFSITGGFLFSLLGTYLFGICEINYVVFMTNSDFSSSGISAEKEEIIKKLSKIEGKLSIIGSEKDINNIVLSKLISHKNSQNSFYTQNIIKNIPQSLYTHLNIPKQSLIFVRNTLIIRELNSSDIQSVSPIIAKIFLKQYFNPRYLKDNDPVTNIMNRQEYLRLREKQIDDVIFKPKKNTNFVGNFFKIVFALIGIGAIGFVILIIIAKLYPSNQTSQDNTTTADNKELTSFPISYLSIENQEAKWIGEELYFIGTLKNSYSSAVKDVVVRLDWYKDKALTEIYDTRKVTIYGAEENGAFSFQVPLNIYPPEGTWWIFKIERADY